MSTEQGSVTSGGAAAPVVSAEQPLAGPAAASGHPAAPVAAEAKASDYLGALHEKSRSQYEPVAKSFMEAGVRPSTGAAAIAWIDDMKRGGTVGFPFLKAEHPYRISGVRDGDGSMITAFANRMAQVGASQQEFDACLTWYGGAVRHSEASAQVNPALASRELERLDLKDRSAGRSAVATTFGRSFEDDLRLANDWLDGMPAAEREKIETARNEHGVLLLNDPAHVTDLVQKARDSVRALGPQAIATEISDIERVMREDRGRYNRDPKMQARLRDLYAARGS